MRTPLLSGKSYASFQRLARAPMSAGELARGMPVTRTAVVQHLKRLESAGLVAASAAGRKRIYRAAPMGLAPLRRWLEAHMEKRVAPRLRTAARR
jgi:DNA-binding transcriptional ArsR family regulator